MLSESIFGLTFKLTLCSVLDFFLVGIFRFFSFLFFSRAGLNVTYYGVTSPLSHAPSAAYINT